MSGERAPASQAVLDFNGLVRTICVGGWPGLRNQPVARAMAATRSRLDDLTRVDLPQVTGTRRDPERVRRLLRSLARLSASSVARDPGRIQALCHLVARRYRLGQFDTDARVVGPIPGRTAVVTAADSPCTLAFVLGERPFSVIVRTHSATCR